MIGDPVAHSLSPAIHNAAIRALGLDAVYVALQTPSASLPTVLAGLAAVGGAGNVTVPHKQAAERCMTRKTDLCTRIGACNTFWSERGSLVGDNTDAPGVLACLRSLGADGAERWLLLGTGGSARAVAVVAADARALLHVRSRDPTQAQAFAEWARARGVNAQAVTGRLVPAVDLAINATPLGLNQNDPLPLDPDAVQDLTVALDLVYARPGGETQWVRALRRAGVVAQDGREMLVQQGALAFRRFFPGETAPTEVMRAAVARALRA